MSSAESSSQAGQSEPDTAHVEMRRSGRARKEPDRLDVTITPSKKKTKKEPFNCEVVMEPAPSDLRGILKDRPADRPFPPPRKSSLTANTGKSILKKYRKVRITRRLHFKVIPPLPGWRPDVKRLPEVELDEEEQKRREEVAEKEEKKAEARRKKRKRKSVGAFVSPLSISDDGDATTEGGTEEVSSADDEITSPPSPEVFFEGYMKDYSPDSALTSDSETDERSAGGQRRRVAAAQTLFPPIEESPTDDAAQQQGTVDDHQEDTVARAEEEAPPPQADAKKTQRRRSVRIQPMEEEQPKPAEKRERRKEKMFPVTPVKGSPLPAATPQPPVKVTRRKSGVVRAPEPAKKKEEQTEAEEAQPTFLNPWNDEPCETEEQYALNAAHNSKIKANKVMAWLARPDTRLEEVAAAAAAAEGGQGEAVGMLPQPRADAAVDGAAAKEEEDEVIEDARGSVSCDSQLSDNPFTEAAAKPVEQQQSKLRKGRRSCKMPLPAKEEVRGGGGGRDGKENEATMSKSNSSSSSKKKEEAKEQPKTQQHHPFFAQFAPKPSPVAAPAVEVTVAPPPPPPPEKKPARRRTMFVPKDTVAAPAAEVTVPDTPPPPPPEKKPARRRTMFVPKKLASSKKEEGEDDEEDEDAIEIVAEVTKAARKEQEEVVSASTATSVWRSTEIDAAPYAGLVHVGREEEKEQDEAGEEGEEVVRKMRRLSVRLQPRLSSYAIPASLRTEEGEEPAAEMVLVFDEERTEGLSDRAAALARRARDLPPDAAYAWPEAMRPRRVHECVGDEQVLAEGKRWLQKWKKRLDAACEEEEKATKEPKAKRKKRRGGAYSDESEQEDSDSDYEVRDEDECRLPNPLVLSGPIGCGKTAYIRALSAEFGFSILESSPDERRAGVNLRAKLAGAVASYRISKSSGGIAFFFSPKAEKKKEEEEQKKGRQHTLVVIEHIDVVFAEEDRLFWPALAEILATTKIPIVLICNVVPDELARVLAQAEAAGGADALEMTMDRGGGGSRVAEYVEASLTGATGRSLSTTVIPAIASRARHDLRAALHDAHWAAAAASLSQADLSDSSMRRVDDPAFCDTVAAQSFAWSDECARRADAMSASELCRAGEWPARVGMPADAYTRLCKQIDEIDQDASREATARAERAMEMARSGVSAGSGGRAVLLSRREIATDWMPVLEQIDRVEQAKRKEYGRRHQHYFNVIKDLERGVSIDPLDRIQGACAFFRLPQN